MNISRISIIIPNYNGAQFLDICLSSIFNQTYTNFDVTIIDNGSIDNSEHICSYYKVNFLKLNRNTGFSNAVNYGIKNSSGDIVFLLNNDTELEKNCLEEINIFFKKNESDIMACKMIYYYEKDKINSAGDLFSIYGISDSIGRGKNIDSQEFSKQKRVFSACAGAAAYKRSLFKEIGYFDEDFFAYMEDIDFGFRANLQNKQCLYNPKAIIYHVHGGTSKKMGDFTFFLTARNSSIVIIKNIPAAILIKSIIPILIGQLRLIVSGLKHKKLKLIIKSYFYILKNFSKIIKKRRYIQKNRKIKNSELWKLLDKKYPFNIKKSITG